MINKLIGFKFTLGVIYSMLYRLEELVKGELKTLKLLIAKFIDVIHCFKLKLFKTHLYSNVL